MSKYQNTTTHSVILQKTKSKPPFLCSDPIGVSSEINGGWTRWCYSSRWLGGGTAGLRVYNGVH